MRHPTPALAQLAALAGGLISSGGEINSRARVRIASFLILIAFLPYQARGQADARFTRGDSAVTKERVEMRPRQDSPPGAPTKMLDQFERLEVLDVGVTGVRVRRDPATTGWVYYRKLMTMEEATEVIAETEREREATQKRREAGRKHIGELRRKGYSIELDNLTFSINSAGGVTPVVTFDNISRVGDGKTVKYAAFTLTPYNPVGDPVSSTVDGGSTTTVTGVGPIEPIDRATFEFENVWYNSTVDCIEVEKVELEFLDGSSFIYVSDLKDIAERAPNINLSGDCGL